jgi:TonB family protein
MAYDGGVERPVLEVKQRDLPAAKVLRGERIVRVRGSARRRAAAGYRTPMARFLGLSTSVHALILIAGMLGGAAYVRRGGAEHPPAQYTIVIDSKPETVASIERASAEPERQLARERPTESEPTPTTTDAEVEAAMMPSLDSVARAPSASAPTGSEELRRIMGDPRQSWRLAGNEKSGLHVGHVHVPPVSECCGEPQPEPKSPPAEDVYTYPQVVRMAPAKFPGKSRRLGEDGSVLLEMTVGVDGLVKDVRVAETSGYSRLDDCAVAAAWDWVFTPAKRNGVAEVSLARHRYTFRFTGWGG